RSAIFSLTHPSHDVFIVIKLEKILQQGDITECAEPYMKDATDKSRDKAKNNAKWFCERLGKYRMPLAWTAIHLMNIVNIDIVQTCHPDLASQEGERLKDEDLFRFLVDLKRPTNVLKRLKCIPGKMKIDVSPCPPDFPCAITPDLHRVKPYPDQRVRPTREIQEFPPLEVTLPHTTYRNLLYIRPQTINFTNRCGSFHIIRGDFTVQILDSEELCNALPLQYGKSNCPDNIAYITGNSPQTHPTPRNPDFYEEVKMQLPTHLTPRHHLFFSFVHISCQRKQELNPIETPVGYTWLPLLSNGRLRVGEHNLPVSVDKTPPPHYSMTTPEGVIPGVKWVDGHKPVFGITLQSVSTVHILDQHLGQFFHLCDIIDSPNVSPHNLKLMDGSRINDLEQELQRYVISMASETQLSSLVKYLYVVLDKLISMLVRPPVVGGQTVNMGQTCFEAISRILFRIHQSKEFRVDTHQLDGVGVRSVAHKVFHEELVLLFVVSTGNVKDRALQNAWFLFELLTKSMTQHIKQAGLLSVSRSERFSNRFMDDVIRLIKLFCHEINSRFNRDYDFAERLNCCLAFLIRDFLSIMDRGFVFQLIHLYYQQWYKKFVCNICLINVDMPFLPVIHFSSSYTKYNHLLQPPTPSNPHIPQVHHEFHYKGELSIELLDQGAPNLSKVQLYATTTLRNLMMSHDEDDRINASHEVKRAVAALYSPLVAIAIQALPYAHLFDEEHSQAKYISYFEAEIVDFWSITLINTPVFYFFYLLFTFLAIFHIMHKCVVMSADSTRNLLLCFIWMLKNTDRSTLRSWWITLPPSHLVSLLDLLYISISCFEYKQEQTIVRHDVARTSFNRGAKKKDSKSRLQEAILGESSARREMLMRRRGGGGGKDMLRWQKDKTEWKQYKHGEHTKQSAEDALLAKNFSAGALNNIMAEMTLITLDTLELLIDMATEYNNGNHTSQILSSALRVLLHCFSKQQSVTVLEHMFAVQRSFVAKVCELLFEEETEQCADLTLRLLEKCSSSMSAVRVHAAASMYLLMKHNFSMGNNFARVKMQVTMSMSSLVGVSHDFDEDYLRRSLKTALNYAEVDSDLEGTSFPDQVRELVFNLQTILSDTVKMKEHQEDPEMLIDLMHRIAKGYQNSPDLRLTWLQNMARQHSERKNQAEAGMCLLHSAALVAEYLSMLEHKSHLPIGCVAFQESAVSDDVVSPNADEVCSEKFFSISGLMAVLEQAVQTFSLAGLHEVVDMIYKILIPIYQHDKDYKKLSNIHEKLRDCFQKINSQLGKRMFGTYFRVGFYGRKFGDLNNNEFIYKEPAITKLPEISYRLETFYSQCFGAEYVEMMKDSSQVDVTQLDPEKAYIQITYVEPYFHHYEDGTKTTYFERNFNVDKFMYATPFTKDGKAHGEMVEQYKRKTFLQVSHTFPYLKTRINVIKKWETVLTPLESACEDVKRKTTDLLRAVHLEPADVRMLQVNLQGAVLTSVNQIPDDPKLWIPYNDLRLSFKQFIYACSVALKKNKSLISTDQKEYQREMERNYHKMNDSLKPMVNNREV
uniref:DOCKER domain-containing protein n=1 Tax=Ciona savignyi TaxID=51511 RepID=H2Y8Y5_CIOSA